MKIIITILLIVAFLNWACYTLYLHQQNIKRYESKIASLQEKARTTIEIKRGGTWKEYELGFNIK